MSLPQAIDSRSNGECPDNEVFNPNTKLAVKKTLKVKVYVGDGWRMDFKQTQFDMHSPPDFYARKLEIENLDFVVPANCGLSSVMQVGIVGVPADEVMKKTKIKEDNRIPQWEEEFMIPLQFRTGFA